MADQTPTWPDPDESQDMMKIILDHYMKHHEIVLKKLQFAQTATQKSIDEIRAVHEKIEKEGDNTNLHTFKDFDQMWSEIIELFIEGGVSQDELFAIEDAITKIPKDIKTHYDQLTQQDKSFLTLVESLNTAAYRKAREVVSGLQSEANPMSGLRPDEYEARAQTGEGKEDSGIAFRISAPLSKKK